MDTITDDMCYERIEELVKDELKIVTGLSLAVEMNIPLQRAQTMISEYCKKHTEPKFSFGISYVVSGQLKDNGGLSSCLSDEGNLKQTRADFEKVDSEVIFSIQQGLLNLETLLLNEANIDLKLLEIPTASKNCIRRSIKVKHVNVPVAKTSHSKMGKNSVQSMFKNSKSTKAETVAEKSEQSKNEDKVTDDQIKQESKPGTQKSKPKGGIASFLSKSVAKPKEVSKHAENKSDMENVDTSMDFKENGLNIINKATQEPPQDMEVDETSSLTTHSKKLGSNSSSRKDGNNTKQTTDSKKRKKSQKSGNPNVKKRKRIQVVLDSDDEDIFGADDDDDIVENSDEEPPPAPVPIRSSQATKNKLKKSVDKTYVDEEGFIVTNTEYVYESESDKDDDDNAKVTIDKNTQQIAKKPDPPASSAKLQKNGSTSSESDAAKQSSTGKGGRKKNKPPTTGKQPTIMSFFTKA